MTELLPIAIQTLWADLNESAWSGNLRSLAARSTGSVYAREVKGRRYWYLRVPSANGNRPRPRYLGPETPDLLRRIQHIREEAEGHRQRRDMVRSLRAARLPVPDPLTGDVLAALAEAGTFRLRATVVGSVAFTCYPGLLGIRLPATLSRTSDLDIGQFHSISIAVEDEIDEDMLRLLQRVDKRFTAILDPFDSRKVLKYALQVGGQEQYSVDILSPLRGPDRGRLTRLKALRADAQLMRYLDFLLYQEQNAVLLHGAGIPVNIPAPERYGLHKLIVAITRLRTSLNPEKARKDIDQANALIKVLSDLRPGDLADAWQELRERGPAWSRIADEGAAMLPRDTRALLTSLKVDDGPSAPPPP